MADQYKAAHVNNTDSRSLADKRSTPDGTTGVEFTNPGCGSTLAGGLTDEAEWGIYHVAGAPSTNFASVPNGSIIVDVTNAKLYIKTGMPGSGISGTVTKEANA